MNKTDLIKNVAENAELTKKDAEKAIKAVFEEISQALADGPHKKLPFSFLTIGRNIGYN